ncbi:hypothetical protein ACLBX9_08475 [Methylobacterium sp. A49B]
MQTIFSSQELRQQIRFQRWREVMCENLADVKLERLSDRPFESRLDFVQYGSLNIGRIFHGSMRAVAARASARGRNARDELQVIFNLQGRSWLQHDDREAVCHTGDFTVTDQRPAAYVTEESTHLLVNLPRDRMERMLGPSRLFTATPVGQGSKQKEPAMSEASITRLPLRTGLCWWSKWWGKRPAI